MYIEFKPQPGWSQVEEEAIRFSLKNSCVIMRKNFMNNECKGESGKPKRKQTTKESSLNSPPKKT